MQSLINRRPAPGTRRDPAPSKWDYRLQRWMLTPYVRGFLLKGLPSLVVAGGFALWFAQEPNRQALIGQLSLLRDQFEARPEFRVSLARIEGASDDLAEAVREKLALPLPMSSFDIDLDAARARIEVLDAVKSADLRVRSGGILQVTITERKPVAVWRTEDGLLLVDETGRRVAGLVSRADRPDLPLIAGVGADSATPEALDLIAAAGPLAPRMRGLVRVGERRWDLVLDRNQRVLLPEKNPVQALERLLALDQAQDLMNRDILTVDLRSNHRPTLRLTPNALAELRRAEGLDTVENEL
ncbi:cell division protein FtsQ/DivIB [Tabrizicola sp.]|jgi:cell division protein FtsQ|uniref:cell division protein FtsQ/DivIB n=1 Tax=Tabrizicola sp. TaxID=2005166 RepID=UPI0025D5C703|nr:cell division protein FtsQ/DivIB [Tabrizicola sp.]MBY0350408.1 cell division protein FtsQ/DivIB [Tabrizicola sp.]